MVITSNAADEALLKSLSIRRFWQHAREQTVFLPVFRRRVPLQHFNACAVFTYLLFDILVKKICGVGTNAVSRQVTVCVTDAVINFYTSESRSKFAGDGKNSYVVKRTSEAFHPEVFICCSHEKVT